MACAVVCVVFVVRSCVMSLCDEFVPTFESWWMEPNSRIQIHRGFIPQGQMTSSKAVGKLSWSVLGLK